RDDDADSPRVDERDGVGCGLEFGRGRRAHGPGTVARARAGPRFPRARKCMRSCRLHGAADRLIRHLPRPVLVQTPACSTSALRSLVVSARRPGYGAAYRAGLSAARGDVVVTLDGDGTYPPEAIPQLVDTLVERRLDFLSACRFPLADRRAMSPTNRFGNWVL